MSRLVNLLCGGSGWVAVWWMFFVCSSSISGVSSFSCPWPCIPSRHCTGIDISNCPHGVVMDACFCCQVCGRGPGESCGIFSGDCGVGLECERDIPPGLSPMDQAEFEGVCVEGPTEEATETTDSAGTTAPTTEPGPTSVVCTTEEEDSTEESDQMCREQCSVSFCASTKHRICSARGTELSAVPSRGHCQHTSCRACFLVVEPDCSQHTCPEPPTKKCLQAFYKCIHRGSQLLRLDSAGAQNTAGRVVCSVPDLIASQS